MNISEFEFHKARQNLINQKVSVASDVRFMFLNDCEKLGIRPTIPRLLDWLDHWTKEYMSYTMEDEENDKPFAEWKPKR